MKALKGWVLLGKAVGTDRGRRAGLQASMTPVLATGCAHPLSWKIMLFIAPDSMLSDGCSLLHINLGHCAGTCQVRGQAARVQDGRQHAAVQVRNGRG